MTYNFLKQGRFSLTGKRQFDNNFNELSIGFFDFFQYYNDKSVIDLLIVDVDGSEYAIFQLLAGVAVQ